MDGWDWLSVVAMLMLWAILTVLLMQYLRLEKMGQVLEQWRASTQERQRRIERQAELQSALRAEKAHVQQLLRRVEILQASILGKIDLLGWSLAMGRLLALAAHRTSLAASDKKYPALGVILDNTAINALP